MMRLFTNGFSPFARKVMLALDYKGLAFEAVDGLSRANHAALWAANPRGEVPTLIDGDVAIAHSSHILQYLDDAYPQRPILPATARDRARARTIERLYDVRVDAILVDCSLWFWAKRTDAPPAGLLQAGQRDLESAFAATEELLGGSSAFAFGDVPGVVEFALWPHLSALKPLGFVLDERRFSATVRWLRQLRELPLFAQDLERTRESLRTMSDATHEREKIAWRGDRLEWLLARGFHEWFLQEIRAERVMWPIDVTGPSFNP